MVPSEPAVEELLVRIVPGLTESWQGASSAEIERLEAAAGRPLPAFYRWFLSRMGKSMGPMRYPTVDFSAQAILGAYSARHMAPDPRYFLIGFERDELTPLHYFYDLEGAQRGDALVVRMLTPRDECHEQFETFREMLAWGELWAARIEGAPQHCRGTLRANGDLRVQLDGIARQLGFAEPIETGSCCGLYERSDATLVWTGTPNDAPGPRAFGLGGHDAAALARILAELERHQIEVRLSAWSPPLAGAS